MLKIIPTSEFKEIPWKNGLGKTIEMAINDGGSVDNFEWRISQATVVNDGDFSDFSGLERNLILIKGEGIELAHKDCNGVVCQQDRLQYLLEYANFDGGYQTHGKLLSDPIVDLNIMTARDKFTTGIMTAKRCQQLTLPQADLVFIYSLNDGLTLNHQYKTMDISTGALIKITDVKVNQYSASGDNVIIVMINNV